MDIREAWNIMSDYISNLESLAETVDAYRNGDEVWEDDHLVDELALRTEESGGQDKINEAFKTVYDAIEPMMPPVKPIES